MITVYVDESGTHAGAPLLTVAACATGGDNWERFAVAWTQHLRKAKCACFHAKERSQRGLKKRMLTEIVKQPLFACITSVRAEDFDSSAGAQYQAFMGDAYATCAYWSAVKIDQWAEKYGYDEVAYVIENGQPYAKHVRRVLEASISLPKFRTVSVALAKKQAFVQLQVADFLGHSRSTDNRWLPKLRRAIEETGEFEDVVLTREEIADATGHVERVWREAGIDLAGVGT